jgi:hypothetical protein
MTFAMRSRSQLTSLGLCDYAQPVSLKEEKKSRLSGSAAFFLVSCVGHAVGFLLLFSRVIHVPAVRDVLSSGNYFVQSLSVNGGAIHAPQKSTSAIENPDSQSADLPKPDTSPLFAPQEDPESPELLPADFAESKTRPTSPAATKPARKARKPVDVLPEVSASVDTNLALDPSNDEHYFLNMSIDASEMVASNAPVTGSASSSAPCSSGPSGVTPSMTTTGVSRHSTLAGMFSTADVLQEGGFVAQPLHNKPCLPSDETLVEAAARWTLEHITRPKDGKFGVVVVDSAASDEYSEAKQIWNGRVNYTAFLHVGLTKNWVLQYSPLRSTDAASGGYEQRVEAPWPYDIFRPDMIYTELDADGLVIHGILNQNGRFESLAVASPAQYAHANLVLSALEQWQFRPARQNGKETAVEVVLIVPNQLD